ncbi:urocortin-3-like [Entelurus aequoreus]|uniref:urocortin-3-like n=1 Tax=Entelurus aequoreus TaxID=161455 RepID=UPI002B1D4EA2|nr:urocortin-3-like [Entelurus aequoreus]XP_061913605.1 urocortin-3-like [Entelurus aequoreus]
MRAAWLCFCLLLLHAHKSSPALARSDEDTERGAPAVDAMKTVGASNSVLGSERRSVLRQERAPRLSAQVPKRAQQGSRFALSLDVPTSILSVLIDLAKNQDLRTKAAANAELMARIGKRK